MLMFFVSQITAKVAPASSIDKLSSCVVRGLGRDPYLVRILRLLESRYALGSRQRLIDVLSDLEDENPELSQTLLGLAENRNFHRWDSATNLESLRYFVGAKGSDADEISPSIFEAIKNYLVSPKIEKIAVSVDTANNPGSGRVDTSLQTIGGHQFKVEEANIFGSGSIYTYFTTVKNGFFAPLYKVPLTIPKDRVQELIPAVASRAVPQGAGGFKVTKPEYLSMQEPSVFVYFQEPQQAIGFAKTIDEFLKTENVRGEGLSFAFQISKGSPVHIAADSVSSEKISEVSHAGVLEAIFRSGLAECGGDRKCLDRYIRSAGINPETWLPHSFHKLVSEAFKKE